MQPPIIATRRADQLRDQIEDDIVTGTLAAGTRLDEQELAARLTVSRTPIRRGDRARWRGRSGDIAARSRGVRRRLRVRDIVERFEVMAALEGMCGRLAARRITEAGRAALIETHEACRRAAADGDPDPYYYENERFDIAIYDAGRNVFLAEQAQHLRPAAQTVPAPAIAAAQRVPQSLAEHDGIVAAILTGAADEAERRLKDHILIQGERLTDLVATSKPPTTRRRPATADRPRRGPAAAADSAARAIRSA